METISQRKMRNNSSRVLAAVRAGESYTVTNDGVPVAMLVPVTAGAAAPAAARPARVVGGFGRLHRHRIDGTVAGTLADLRGER